MCSSGAMAAKTAQAMKATKAMTAQPAMKASTPSKVAGTKAKVATSTQTPQDMAGAEKFKHTIPIFSQSHHPPGVKGGAPRTPQDFKWAWQPRTQSGRRGLSSYHQGHWGQKVQQEDQELQQSQRGATSQPTPQP
eukprot:EG_transcript_46263